MLTLGVLICDQTLLRVQAVDARLRHIGSKSAARVGATFAKSKLSMCHRLQVVTVFNWHGSFIALSSRTEAILLPVAACLE